MGIMGVVGIMENMGVSESCSAVSDIRCLNEQLLQVDGFGFLNERLLKQYAVAVYDGYVVEQTFYIVYLVGADDDGLLFRHAFEQYAAELTLREDVQPVRRLVHQEVACVGGQGQTHIYLLLLTHAESAQVYLGTHVKTVEATVEQFVAEVGVEGFQHPGVLSQRDAGHVVLLGHKEKLLHHLRQALGGLHAYGYIYPIETIRMSIVQPRLDNVNTFECSREELEAWGESIKPIAKMAFEGKGEQNPGEWCRFCRAKPVCKACAKEALSLCREEFLDLDAGALSEDPRASPDELSDLEAPYQADTTTPVFKQPGLIPLQVDRSNA